MNLLHNVWLIILFNYYSKERNKESISLETCSPANLYRIRACALLSLDFSICNQILFRGGAFDGCDAKQVQL